MGSMSQMSQISRLSHSTRLSQSSQVSQISQFSQRTVSQISGRSRISRWQRYSYPMGDRNQSRQQSPNQSLRSMGSELSLGTQSMISLYVRTAHRSLKMKYSNQHTTS